MVEPKIELAQEILQLIAEIDEFKGSWEALRKLAPEHLAKLRRVATIESIASSTRIEGATLSDAEVDTLLLRVPHTSFTTRDEQEVAGYAEAIDLVFQAYDELSITENHIRQLHQTLLRHSLKDERHRGDYKKLPNNVVAFDEKGVEVGIVFETTSPFDTPRRMEDLFHWANKAIAEKSLHPLLIVAVFIVVFLAIHPFQDGNGRLSRIITTLMLLRFGYAYVPFSSLEHVVEENKDLYYNALRRTQRSLRTEKPDWQPWLAFFLRCLSKQKANLADKISEAKHVGAYDLNELSSRILDLFSSNQWLSISGIVKLTGANHNTVKVRLRELVAAGLIVKSGKARATIYRLG